MNNINLGENLGFGQNGRYRMNRMEFWGVWEKNKVDIYIEWEQNTVGSES